MKRQNASDACRPPRRDCLGHTCGTNIDTEGVEFTRESPHLTYIDKVFSFNKDTASPLLFNLNTGGMQSENYTTELFLEGNSLFPCTLSPDAVFEIDNSFVAVDFFSTRPPGNIYASQVTVDGFPVDSVSFANGQYTARTDNLVARVQKNRCLERNLPTKVFFLISNAGPWDFRATYVLEGTVNTGGRNCRFRAVISNAPNSSNSMLPNNGLSSFSVRNLSLPCSVNGIAPEIQFQFSANVNLVNPRLVAVCGESQRPCPPPCIPCCPPPCPPPCTPCCPPPCPPPCIPCCPPCPPCPPAVSPLSCTVALISNVSIEPVVQVQTVRKTLFCLNACEGLQPCDGSLRAVENEENAEDCEIGGVDRPDCRCRSGGSGNRPCREDTSDDAACRPCRDESAGNRDCRPRRRPENLGGCDRRLIRDLARELCDDMEDTSDVDDTSECSRSDTRPAFRLHGCNGCSW